MIVRGSASLTQSEVTNMGPSEQRMEIVEKGAARASGRITITDLAQQLGVSVKTILRWEKAGKIRKARRDWRGWRVYAQEDIIELRGFFETVY